MNTTELINTLKIKGSFPTSNDLFSTADFLNIFNHQMKTEITPLLLRLGEEFFLQSKDFVIESGVNYRIPTRAVGAKIRDIQIIGGGGSPSAINRLLEEDRPLNTSGYYIVRNSVELSSDYTSGTLRMKYFARPSTLVSTSDCAKITSINTVTNSVVVSSAPATFATGMLVDLVQNLNPYDLLMFDTSLVNVSGTTFTFSSLPRDLAIGDWVCIATESPVPLIPEELHPVLVQSALVSCLSSKKDKALEVESARLMKNIEDALNMLDPRVENNSTKMRSGKLLSFFSSRRY